MRSRALGYLACPECAGRLALRAVEQAASDAHIMEGTLRCEGCDASFAIRGGIPRFMPDVSDTEERTARAFGYEWTHYDELDERYRQQFLDWIGPVEPAFFQGRAVLEGGCGKGRHSVLAAEFGALDVVSIDLGVAVDAAFQNTRRLQNVHIVQADLKRPPVRPVFDYAFSIGVLHHLPVPEEGFRALVSRLKPGGNISAWVYGREGNGWIVHVVSPVRERVTSRMPPAVLDRLSGVATLPLYLVTKLLYGPTRGGVLGRRLPYGEYLAYIADFPWREQRTIVFDHLVAPVAHYIRREELEAWFVRAGLEAVSIRQHNANSWSAFGRLRAAPAGTAEARSR